MSHTDRAADRAAPRFTCHAGTVVGRHDGDVVRALGIRYARADRFAPPVAEPPATEPVQATAPSPACPQPVSPLLHRMFGSGFGDLGQDEHCQRLSVTLPADATPDERLPVMVFLHGGSYVYGAADVPMHDPAALVREQRVVVVGVTYRLGLFGFLGDGGERPANLGLLDQVEALRWVQRNIEAFGGDAGNVTLFGESAGADAIAHLMVADGARGLFRRAIMQSAPLGISRGRSAMSAAMLAAAGDIDAGTPPEEVVARHDRVEQAARRFGLTSGMPFGTQYGHAPLPAEDDVDAAWSEAAPGVDVLVGSNSRESAFFVSNVPPAVRLAGVPVVGRSLIEAVGRVLTWRIYRRDVLRFARRHRRAGGRASTYLISWGAPGNPLRGAHTIDLVLLFPDRAAWEGSPLVHGARWEDVVDAGRPVRQAWADFARTGHLRPGRHGAALRVGG